MGILGIDLNNITFDDNYHQHDPKTIIQVRVLAWHIKCEKPKALKKRLNIELMLIVWHPKRSWSFACQKMRKKK